MREHTVPEGECHASIAVNGHKYLCCLQYGVRIFSQPRASFAVYRYVDGLPRWRVWGGYVGRRNGVWELQDVEWPTPRNNSELERWAGAAVLLMAG